MATSASFFMPITKVAPTPDGYRMVTGKVSTERVDLDGQIADYGWAKKEAQAWFDIANVREQHSRNVVGKGLDLQLDDASREVSLTAKVVDPVAITKLDEGLFTGFSFGAKNVPGNPIKVVKDAQAPQGRIVGGKWVEISLADRPANEDSKLAIAKAVGATLEVSDVLGEFAETDEAEKVVVVEEEKVVEPEVEKQLSGTDAQHNDSLTSAKTAIRQLIAQEAGETDELNNGYQIQYLVDALNAVCFFESSEAFEGQYGAMVTQMASITDKPTRRGLYKDVSEALVKAAEAHKAKLAAADTSKTVNADGTPAAAPVVETPPQSAAPSATATTEKVVEPDTEKFLTAESIKALLPDQLKAMLPELLKEHAQVLKEALAETFAGKELEKTVETLGKRAQPGGPVMNADAAGLRTIEKSHPVNAVVEPGDVPLDALQEMAKYAELSKVDDIPTAHSARRMLTKLQNQYGVVPG